MDSFSDVLTAALPAKGIEFKFNSIAGLDYIASLIRRDGFENYEKPMPELLALLARMSDGFFLDIGANTGLYSLLAAAANPFLKVCAFEPLSNIGKLLRDNIAINPGLASRIQVYDVGLSNVAGSFDFYEHINDQGLVATSSSFELNHVQTGSGYRKHTVNTMTLDSWVCQLGDARIAAMKIDVEGHEYAVIEGGRQTIERHRPFMTIEVLGPSRVDKLDELLFEANYCDFAITPDSLRHCQTIRHHPDGWNHLLCPAEQVGALLTICRELNIRMDIG